MEAVMSTFTRVLVGVLLAASIAKPSAASVPLANFSGSGFVTFADAGSPVSVGAPVRVRGSIFFGDGSDPNGPAALPNGFTGTVVLDRDFLYDGLQAFRFDVFGGSAGVDTTTDFFAYAFASATLVDGRLTGLSLFVDEDQDVSELTTSTFRRAFGFHESGPVWGGVWVLRSSIPESATWAMLLIGFAGVGAAIRRRRRALQTSESRLSVA
jgi:hypothetical protein